jgi:L-rhamnose isomerase
VPKDNFLQDSQEEDEKDEDPPSEITEFEEFMELEDMQVWDMYCQVYIISRELRSMEEVKFYYGTGCVLFGFEYLPFYDEFITSGTYK